MARRVLGSHSFTLTALAASLLVFQPLAQAEEELDAVIVTASGTQHSQMSAPAFTSVIGAEELRNNPTQSVADLIGRNVGVLNSTDSSGRDDIRVRGLGGSYTLVLVNGKRVSSSNALWRGGDFDFSSIPRSSIERIEVVRGPMSSLYGADAMGGVINIITKQAPGQWSASLDSVYELVTEGEDGKELRTNLSAAGPLATDVYLRVSAEVYDRDAWYQDTSDQVPEREEKQARNLSSSLSWDVDNQQTLSADLSLNQDERPYGVYSSGPDYREQDIQRTTLGLSHEGHWTWGMTRLSANLESGEIDDYNSRYPSPKQRHLEEENLTLAANTSMNLGMHGLSLGYEFRNQEVKDAVSFTQSGGSDAAMQAVFVQDEMLLTDQLTLTLGGRYDHHDDFGGEFTPRGYLVYQLSDGLSLKGGVSTAYKAPSPHQIVEEYQIVSCGGSCFIPGNPDLVPETSTSFEAGAEIDQQSWRMSAVVFRTQVEDMISATRDSVTGDRSWENLNEVELQGVELEGDADLTSSVRLDASYAYLDTEENGEGELEYRPRHQLNLGVNWAFLDASEVRLGARHTGTQVNSSDEEQDAYTELDLAVNSRLTQALVVRGGINNLTNVSLDDDGDDYASNLVGRSIYAGFSYDF
ncbi:TonB-dependent receptor plug domain-containing protein [Marinospirillum perlucidum]|uniref:TonB-dependent receptor plug domain-containing protein n=1 Tax=Marinospirillum perlucidum TaxID=1982602 RepID=UPI000DF45EF6|nr:TonB-dependent receptor [Marinospirillum perlucidum]